MASWLNQPGSLNWANKTKLMQDISRLEETILQVKEKLFILISVVNQLETQSKELSELKNRQRLTAKHILELSPMLHECESLDQELQHICKQKTQAFLEVEHKASVTK